MNEIDVKRVPFMGAELMAAQDKNGQIWAGVRWMCEGIGFNKSQTNTQVEKIKEDGVLSKGYGNFRIPTNGGMQETACIKLDYMALWLAKISITQKMRKDNPALAERLETYQLKAKDALAEAFLGKNVVSYAMPKDYPSALRALADAEEKKMKLEAQVEADRPNVQFAKAVEGSYSTILVRDLAKILRQNGVEMGEKRLFEWLRNKGYLIQQAGRSYNLPTQRALESGLFKVKETAITHTTGTQTHLTPLVTGKGQKYFVNLFLANKMVEDKREA